MSSLSPGAGRDDMLRAARLLADQLPDPLRPLAAVAYNYWWTWQADGPAVFAAIDAARWERCGHNPVRLLREAPVATLHAAAADPNLVAGVERLAHGLEADLARPPRTGAIPADHPVAFLCAEFGIHASLPIYSGGLGVLAGDFLKQASDVALPMIGVGLLYRSGYFHQRLDTSGFQHEYWTEPDPEGLPCVPVTTPDDSPLRVTVPIHDEDVAAQVWRVDVGRVPLYLLDCNLDENSEVGRWVTSRLYEGNREVRLAQYAVLGVGGARVLRTLGVQPSVYHLNEGHPALAALELVSQQLEEGVESEEAWRRVRSSLVFTTHTPVAAGNETYARSELERILGRVIDLTGDREGVLAMGRTEQSDSGAPSGLSSLAVRASRSVNGVSRRHGQVARAMWQACWPDRAVDDVPITHVTNGVHAPTWVRRRLREVLDEHLGPGWLERADDPTTWAPVGDIPDEDVWGVRNDARRRLVDHVRARATRDRLRRGEDIGYAEAAQHGLDPDVLTIGFARRVATYKRIHLLGMDTERAMRLLNGDRPVQLLLAGKAHPQDDGAKRAVQELFHLKAAPGVAGRVVFLEDYDLALAGELVAGCDLWVNLPRPPFEASGTSGMKAALNAVLNLSVLDGWWAEMYDRTNGWAIDGDIDSDVEAQDRAHAKALYDLLEHDVIPAFYDRDERGVPRRWVAKAKRALQTLGPQVAALRMLRTYVDNIYAM
jgi:starch phosphorylase